MELQITERSRKTGRIGAWYLAAGIEFGKQRDARKKRGASFMDAEIKIISRIRRRREENILYGRNPDGSSSLTLCFP